MKYKNRQLQNGKNCIQVDNDFKPCYESWNFAFGHSSFGGIGINSGADFSFQDASFETRHFAAHPFAGIIASNIFYPFVLSTSSVEAYEFYFAPLGNCLVPELFPFMNQVVCIAIE